MYNLTTCPNMFVQAWYCVSSHQLAENWEGLERNNGRKSFNPLFSTRKRWPLGKESSFWNHFGLLLVLGFKWCKIFRREFQLFRSSFASSIIPWDSPQIEKRNAPKTCPKRLWQTVHVVAFLAQGFPKNPPKKICHFASNCLDLKKKDLGAATGFFHRKKRILHLWKWQRPCGENLGIETIEW